MYRYVVEAHDDSLLGFIAYEHFEALGLVSVNFVHCIEHNHDAICERLFIALVHVANMACTILKGAWFTPVAKDVDMLLVTEELHRKIHIDHLKRLNEVRQAIGYVGGLMGNAFGARSK